MLLVVSALRHDKLLTNYRVSKWQVAASLAEQQHLDPVMHLARTGGRFKAQISPVESCLSVQSFHNAGGPAVSPSSRARPTAIPPSPETKGPR